MSQSHGAPSVASLPPELRIPLAAALAPTEQSCVSLVKDNDPGYSCTFCGSAEYSAWRSTWRCFEWLCMLCTPPQHSNTTTINKTWSGWMRLIVGTKMDAVIEQSGRQSACSRVDVDVGAGPRKYPSLYGATAPPSLLWGLAAHNMSLLHYCYSDALFFLKVFSTFCGVPPPPGREEAADQCRTFHISVQYCGRANYGIVSRV